MELVCIKFNEKMDSENAVCTHTSDYCKYRTSCIIHFMEMERKSDAKREAAKNVEKPLERGKDG